MSDFSLNYRLAGSGPPLLMIHGFGISFNLWKFLLPYLGPHFTLIMIELPGIGSSSPPQPESSYLDEAARGVERIRDLLGIEHWSVFSYSSGTRIAEKYINLYPERVERAIFLCPAQISPVRAVALHFAIQLDRYIPQIGNWVLSGPRLKILIDLLGFNLKKNPLSFDWFTEISSQTLDVLKETLRSLPNGGKQPFCVPNGLPSLFVWGSEDLITSTPRKPAAQDCIIQATHSAPQTAVQMVSDIVISFLISNGGKPEIELE